MQTIQRRFSSSLIGQRLIEAGYLTEEQLQDALTMQVETALLFGEVCMLKGWVTYEQLKECLPKTRSRLGERLLANGYITIQQLWLALLEQRQSGRRLGDIVVDRGWVDRTVVEDVMS